MRSRFRSEPRPRGPREGRPLELVRVRGTQRDARASGRRLNRRPRRRSRPANPPSPPPRPSPWAWLKSLFTGAPPQAERPTRGPARGQTPDQETRALEGFAHHFGIRFHNQDILRLALTHRSYLSVTGGTAGESNERLEFLGDSVLGLVTSEFLYREHPTEHEGQLTKTKSLLVSKAILSRRALAIGLGKFVLMSHSEVESGGRQRLSILADAFEAVVGAIYLDQGFEAARGFIVRHLLRNSAEIAADKRHTNYKSHLQEYVQSTFRTHPVYRIRSEMGPDHSKLFSVEVMVGRRTLGSGKGPNKKEAEQAAARDALERVEHPAPTVHESRRRTRPQPVEPEPRAAVPVHAPSVEEDEESDEDRPRRRRGRRGGRGRRRSEDAAPPSTPSSRAELPRASASAAPAAAPQPTPPRRRSEPARQWVEPLVEREEPIVEHEPMPPAHEEDDMEEVGRPEGPLEERHVDPYAIENAPLPVEPVEPRRPSRPPAPMADEPAPRELGRSGSRMPETGRGETRGEPAGRPPEAEPPAMERKQPSPAFGRRQQRKPR